MVRLVRSTSRDARYWHRVDERGCGDAGLVQPDRNDREVDVDARDLPEFFEHANKDPCPNCRWEHH